MNVGMKNEGTKECRSEGSMWEWMNVGINEIGNEGMCFE